MTGGRRPPLSPNQVAYPAEPLAQSRYVRPPANLLARSHGLQHEQHFRRRHARSDPIDRRITHRPISLNDKGRRLRNATLLPPVIYVPLLDDAAVRIAQYWERQIQFAPQCLRCLLNIYGDSGQAGPGRADFLVMIPVVRQLAEAEWSPRATIEEQHGRARGDQF